MPVNNDATLKSTDDQSHARPATTPAKLVNIGRGGLVSVLVGEPQVEYLIHKNVLINKSPYFATSLKDCWNGQQNQVELKDTTSDAFQVFVNWAYGNDIKLMFPDVNAEGMASLNTQDIARAYKLADTLMAKQLQDDLIDTILEISERKAISCGFDDIRFVTEHELQDTRLYDLVLRSCVRLFVEHPDQFENEKDDISRLDDAVLAQRVVRALRDYLKEPWGEVWEDERCKYHQHADDKPCKQY